MPVGGVITGVCVSFPRDDGPTNEPRLRLMGTEKSAVEAMASKLPRWARDVGLQLEPIGQEALFTLVIRAMSHGMFDEEPPDWIKPQLLQLELQVRDPVLLFLVNPCWCVRNSHKTVQLGQNAVLILSFYTVRCAACLVPLLSDTGWY